MPLSSSSLPRLSDLTIGSRAVIHTIAADSADIARRLMELGFLEGRSLQVLHRGAPGGDPIAVRMEDLTVALRKSEADFIFLMPEAQP